MYNTHWKLQHSPFTDKGVAGSHQAAKSPNGGSACYYPSAAHHAALLKLRYLVAEHKGVGVLVGDHGIGKSFLTAVLEEELTAAEQGPVIRLLFPQLSPEEMLAYLAERTGAALQGRTGNEILLAFERRLQELTQAGLQPLFIIDDAHVLSMNQLNTLRLLLNLRESTEVEFSMVLVGRNDLLARLKRIAPLAQRLGVRAALEPFDVVDTASYIAHRLKAAGQSDPVFTPAAVELVWEQTQGVPRRINQLCDLAMLVGYVDGLTEIGKVEILTAAEELQAVSSAA